MPPALRKYVIAALVAVAVLGSGAAVRAHYRTRLSAATDSVAVTHRALTSALEAAKAESAWAASQEIVASSYSAVAAREHKKVLVLTDSVNVLRGRFQATAQVAPDTCAPLIAAANALVTSLDTENTGLRRELASTASASDAYRLQADSAKTTLARIIATSVRADSAATGLAKAAHEPFWSRVTPRRQVTVGAGVDASGHPTVAVVFGFGWSL